MSPPRPVLSVSLVMDVLVPVSETDCAALPAPRNPWTVMFPARPVAASTLLVVIWAPLLRVTRPACNVILPAGAFPVVLPVMAPPLDNVTA